MKIIGSVKEDLDSEKRISITPETAKKFASLEFSVCLEKGYAKHLNIFDSNFWCYRNSFLKTEIFTYGS